MASNTRVAKMCAAAATRNSGPIAEVLEMVLKDMLGDCHGPTKILEIASGTGQHASYFASRFQNIVIQPSEYDTCSLSSIAAYAADHATSGRVLPPLHIDVTKVR
ncbi:Protein of unknown function DUF938 [Trinorchestia longiramus]|nr:Protein of unknown function DUF938 [Trinorchestia longiramus]